MARGNTMVPHGYELQEETVKGTLIALGVFDESERERLPKLAAFAMERSFAKLALIPQHEETLRRMKLSSEEPYYKRVEELEAWAAEEAVRIPVTVDAWEGKRKKYTPLDTLLQFATEKYKAPHFVSMTDTYAELFATYVSFDEWIRRVRLIVLTRPGFAPPRKLEHNEHRWEAVYI